MKQIISIILFLLFSNILLAQLFTGVVVDSSTKEPISYVNIGVVGGNTGTVSDSKGKFSLEIPNSFENENIRLSCVGYAFKDISLQEFKSEAQLRISLKAEVYDISEITIKGSEYKQKRVGRKANSSQNTIGYSSSLLGGELARIFKIKKRTVVENFNFYIHRNNNEKIVFRVNFYKLDKDKKIQETPFRSSKVFFVENQKTGRIQFDLSEDRIVLTENTYVSLEVVQASDRKRAKISFGANMGTSYSRYTSQSQWEKIYLLSPGFYLQVKQKHIL